MSGKPQHNMFQSKGEPDFAAIASDVAQQHEASAFTTKDTLAKWIETELRRAWNGGVRDEHDRILKFCTETGIDLSKREPAK